MKYAPTYVIFSITPLLCLSEKNDVSDLQKEVAERLKKKLAVLSREAVKPNIPPNRPPKGFQSPKVWGHAK